MASPRTCTRARKAPRPRLPLFTGQIMTHDKLPSPKELVLHFSVRKELERFCKADWKWTHFPSGELRDDVTAAKLKRMGTKAGWPDFILVSPEGIFHGLELKRKGEGLNDAQQDFHDHAIRLGWKVATADTFTDALAILQGWGCLRIKIVEGR